MELRCSFRAFLVLLCKQLSHLSKNVCVSWNLLVAVPPPACLSGWTKSFNERKVLERFVSLSISSSVNDGSAIWSRSSNASRLGSFPKALSTCWRINLPNRASIFALKLNLCLKRNSICYKAFHFTVALSAFRRERCSIRCGVVGPT